MWTAAGERLGGLKGHTKGVSDCAWDHGGGRGRYLATASDDTTVGVWDVERGAPLRFLKGHTSFVMCVKFHPEDSVIASGSFDETVRLWDTRTGGGPVRVLPAHSDPITAVDFVRDGRHMASSSYDGLVRVWHVDTGRCVETIMSESECAPVGCVRFSPAGNCLLTASQDASLRLWAVRGAGAEGERGTAAPVRTWLGTGGEQFCSSAEFCLHHRGGGEGAAGHLVAAGGDDGRVRFWSLGNKHAALRGLPDAEKLRRGRDPVYVLEAAAAGAEGPGVGHAEGKPVLGVEFHQRAGAMVTASADGTAKVWRLREELRQPVPSWVV